jgi:hypothetical protein
VLAAGPFAPVQDCLGVVIEPVAMLGGCLVRTPCVT